MILTGIYNRMREYLFPLLCLLYSLRQCFQAKRVDGLTWCSQIREQRQEGHFSSPSGKRLCTDNKTNEFSVVNPEWNILLPPLSTSCLMMPQLKRDTLWMRIEAYRYHDRTIFNLFHKSKEIYHQPTSKLWKWPTSSFSLYNTLFTQT